MQFSVGIVWDVPFCVETENIMTMPCSPAKAFKFYLYSIKIVGRKGRSTGRPGILESEMITELDL